MSYEKLLAESKIGRITKKEFDLALPERDLETAKHNLDAGDYDWALSIAYNAVLQAARAMMFHLGYRPQGGEQHKTVFEFLRASGFDREMTNYFDSIRKTRHLAIYDVADTVSESMASEAITEAKDFVLKIRTFVLKIRTNKGT
jgi:uncharacterized protein (UPF0332 family)